MQHCPEEGILTSFGCCPFLSRQARIVFLPGVSLSAAKRFFTRRMMGTDAESFQYTATTNSHTKSAKFSTPATSSAFHQAEPACIASDRYETNMEKQMLS